MNIFKTETTSERPLWRARGLDRDIHRLFGPFLDSPKDWEIPLGSGENFPAVDISETPKEYVLRAEIPGIRKEDTRLSVRNNVLTLSGEKKSEARHEDRKLHLVESRYGTFQRSFVLPDAVQADKVTALYKDGVLTVTVPKPEEARERDVEIRIG
jgi:HSP20 family protein